MAGGSYGAGTNNGIYKCDISESGMLTNCYDDYPFANSFSGNSSSANVTFQNISGIDYIYFTNQPQYGWVNNTVVCQMNNDGTVNAESCGLANFPANATPTYPGYYGWWYKTQAISGSTYQYITDWYYGGLYRCQTGNAGTYSSCSLLNSIDNFPNTQFDIATNVMGNMYLFLPVDDGSNGLISYQLTNNGGTATISHQYTNTSFNYPMRKVMSVTLQPN